MLLALAGGLLGVVDRAAAQPVTAHWLTAQSGNWTTAARWSTGPFAPNNGNPPGSAYRVFIDAAGNPYTVALGSDVSVDSLRLDSSAATLHHTAGVLNVGALDVAQGHYLLDGGTIRGSTINVSGGVLDASIQPGSTLDGVILNGDIGLSEVGAALTIANGLSLNGTIRVGGAAAQLNFSGTQTLAGGNIVFDGSSGGPDRVLNIDDGATLTLGSGVGIRGGLGTLGQSGQTTTLVNAGTISADTAGQPLTVAATDFTNTGTLQVTGGILSLNSAAWRNAGSIG